MSKKGPFEVISSKTVYKNPWIEVKEDSVIIPDGKKGVFGTVEYGQGVTIVALNEKREIYLIKEYFYVLEREGMQAPSGGVDAGETPLEAAKRELLEEAGCTAEQWMDLGILHPFTMIIKSPTYLFLALDVTKGENTDSLVKPVTLPFTEAHQMVLDGRTYHAGSAVAIMKAKEWLKE